MDVSGESIHVAPLSGMIRIGSAPAVVTVGGSAYVGMPTYPHMTSMGGPEPHDQAMTQPLATIEIGGVALALLVYGSLGYVRSHSWYPFGT